MKKSFIQKMLSLLLAAGCVGTAVGLAGCDTLSAEEKEALINEIRAEIENDTGVPVNGDIYYSVSNSVSILYLKLMWHYDEGFTLDENNNKEYINHKDYEAKYQITRDDYNTVYDQIENSGIGFISEASGDMLNLICGIAKSNKKTDFREIILNHPDSSQNTKTII